MEPGYCAVLVGEVQCVNARVLQHTSVKLFTPFINLIDSENVVKNDAGL
jgi:hypothetical protein